MTRKPTVTQEEMDVARQWLDVRNHKFFRVVSARNPLYLADAWQTSVALAEHAEHLFHELGYQLIVYPECSLHGYSILDLIKDEVVQEEIEEGTKYILRQTQDINAFIVFGARIILGSARYNCAIVARAGKIVAIYPKLHAAEGEEFEDARYDNYSGIFPSSVDFAGQEDIPFGHDIVIKLVAHSGVVLHFQVCQDFWVTLPPSSLAAHSGDATVSGVLNASNAIVGKKDYVDDLLRVRSGADYMTVIYSGAGIEIKGKNAGLGESSTDVTYNGRVAIAHRGGVQRDEDQDSSDHVVYDADIRSLIESRADDPSFHLNTRLLSPIGKAREIKVHGTIGHSDKSKYYRLYAEFPKLPFVPNSPEARLEVAKTIIAIKVGSMAKMMLSLPRHIQKPILAISGGSDSTTVAAILALMMDTLERPRSDIIMVTMPGLGTKKKSLKIARKLAKAIGATFYEIPIEETVQLLCKYTGHDINADDVANENFQAWARFQVEEALAAHYGGFIAGTGDLSEAALGNTTHYADDSSAHNMNASDPKTLIYFELEMLAEHFFADDPETAKWIMESRALRPSPELKRTGYEGKKDQYSEDRVGPYTLQDNTMYRKLRWHDSPYRISRIQFAIFLDEFDFPTLVKWLRRFEELFLPNRFKSNTSPSGALQGSAGLSPRSKGRYPGDAKNTSWLRNIDKIPSIDAIEAVLAENR